MSKLSVVIITLNEEKNIERCLFSVMDIADEIVVVDSFSTDRTEEICRRYPVKFIKHTFEGHIEQKNYAVSQASYPHILALDADEALSPILKNSIKQVKNNWEYDGYFFNRITNYCGKWIRHTSWYPARKLRLWDSRKGKWGGINPHDRFILEKGGRQKFLKGDLLHYSYYSIGEHILQINKFSDIISKAYFEKGNTASIFTIISHPFWRLFRDYFIKAGFLDGFYGLVISVNAAYETFLKYSKLRKLIIEDKKASRKTICFFNSAKAWGGGEKWHFDISTRLAEKGFETIVITNKKSELYNRILSSGLKLKNIRVSNLSFLNIFKLMKIVRIFKKEKVGTIIINLSADLKLAGFAGKLANVKNIIYRRGSAIPVNNSTLNRFIFSKIITGIIANSEETKRTVLVNNSLLFDKDKISVIYNGINLKKYDGTSIASLYERKNGEVIIGNAGRLVKQKGQKYLIDVAKKLKDRGVNFKMLIAGEGKLKNDLVKYAKENGLLEEVKFLGFVDNIKSFMESIDIFCLTSLWEGFGYVIVEAMACKKPVVAFDISSNPEIILNNQAGYLVKKNDLDSFSEKIELLVKNSELRLKFGKRGREIVESIFDIDQTLKKVEKVLNEQD